LHAADIIGGGARPDNRLRAYDSDFDADVPPAPVFTGFLLPVATIRLPAFHANRHIAMAAIGLALLDPNGGTGARADRGWRHDWLRPGQQLRPGRLVVDKYAG
jgi:hypothetical protein